MAVSGFPLPTGLFQGCAQTARTGREENGLTEFGCWQATSPGMASSHLSKAHIKGHAAVRAHGRHGSNFSQQPVVTVFRMPLNIHSLADCEVRQVDVT